MPTEITEEQGILRIRITGRWGRADSDRAQADVSDMVGERQIKGTVLDLREGQIDVSLPDALEMTIALGALFPRTTRHTVVIRDDPAMADVAQFAENVAVNRGIQLKVLSSTDAAVQWILEDTEARE
jgi:hypothetical protein